ARATERLLRREAVPQARAGFQSALADYSSGTGELVAAIAAERHVHETEIRLLQAQLDEQVELAIIERLIGGNL
ncbi:MAG: TolC family protein, partial [Rhodospirillales bacterium]|nr:TolC family protein [Rhodospirillales bacterium]